MAHNTACKEKEREEEDYDDDEEEEEANGRRLTEPADWQLTYCRSMLQREAPPMLSGHV